MYVPNPVNFTYVLLSRALEGKQLAAAKDAAAQAVRTLPLGPTSFVAVAAFPGRTANAVVVKTALTSAAVRDTILAEIEAITSDASISDFNAALSAVLDQVRAARTASDLTSGDIVNVATLVNSSDDNSITKARWSGYAPNGCRCGQLQPLLQQLTTTPQAAEAWAKPSDLAASTLMRAGPVTLHRGNKR